MPYWLLKTEPDSWSWQDQIVQRNPKGERGSVPWDGVRNFTARKFLLEMRYGDLCFFYHTGKERRIVGLVEITREAYPEVPPQKEIASFPWICVDVRAVASALTPLSLSEIKLYPELKEMVLLRNSRLSVQPVRAEEWNRICLLMGLDPMDKNLPLVSL